MQSFFRIILLIIAFSTIGSIFFYILATKYEPIQHEEVKILPNIKIRRD